jgi:hypothetical protein
MRHFSFRPWVLASLGWVTSAAAQDPAVQEEMQRRMERSDLTFRKGETHLYKIRLSTGYNVKHKEKTQENCFRVDVDAVLEVKTADVAQDGGATLELLLGRLEVKFWGDNGGEKHSQEVESKDKLWDDDPRWKALTQETMRVKVARNGQAMDWKVPADNPVFEFVQSGLGGRAFLHFPTWDREDKKAKATLALTLPQLESSLTKRIAAGGPKVTIRYDLPQFNIEKGTGTAQKFEGKAKLGPLTEEGEREFEYTGDVTGTVKDGKIKEYRAQVRGNSPANDKAKFEVSFWWEFSAEETKPIDPK